MIPTPIRADDPHLNSKPEHRDAKLPRPTCFGFSLSTRAIPQPNAEAHTDALFLLAERLEASESVWIEARSTMSASRSIELTAGVHLAQANSHGVGVHSGRRLQDFCDALSLSFPHVAMKALDEPQPAPKPGGTAIIPLRGIPVHLSDLVGAADLTLMPAPSRTQHTPGKVLLGACASRTPLSDALRILRRVRHPMSIRLTLRPCHLCSRDIRHLSELYRDLAALRNEHPLTGGEVARVSEVTALVAAWLTAKSGVATSISACSDLPVDSALASALATAFSLPPSARRDTLEPALDLAGCFVRGQRFPALTLDDDVARALEPCPRRRTAGRSDAAASRSTGALIGVTPDDAAVHLDDHSRSRHLLICGSTGTGKSTLLNNLIASDVRDGHGVVLVDPHGDLFEDVLDRLNRKPDIPVWVANTADIDSPYSLNLLQSAGDSYRQNFVCNQLIRLLKRSLYKNVPEGFGPMFEAYFRNAFLLLSDGGNGAHTISDMDRVFGDARFRRELLETCGNEHVQRFWRNIATKAGGEAALENIAPYIVSKLTQFVGNPVISPIVCAQESTIDFNRIMDSGGVCVVNLAKGRVGTTEAEILGGIFTTALFSAALSRAGRGRGERRPVRVYLDEFQSYAGEVISEMLAECRKYGLEMTLATQSLNRLKALNGDLTQSVLGNTANIVALRSGPQDADLLADWIGGGVTRENIVSLDDFVAIARLLEDGRVSPPIGFQLQNSR